MVGMEIETAACVGWLPNPTALFLYITFSGMRDPEGYGFVMEVINMVLMGF